MCLVNEDVFFFLNIITIINNKPKPSILLVALGSVCKLAVVGFSSPCQFQLHRDR